jgi:hypothetical protein
MAYLIAFLAACVVLAVVAAFAAPQGWEDVDGFHYGTKEDER